MEGNKQRIAIRGRISQWILLCFILPQTVAVCNVLNCNPSQCNGSACYSCDRGYYRQSGTCVQCPDKCSTCTNSTQCTTCKDAYWSLGNHCAFVCDPHCTDSGCNDINYCYDCKPGFYGAQCNRDCKIYCKDGLCDSKKCTNGCKDSYYQITTGSGLAACYKCEYDNCITCFNGTYCTECEQGYYRNYIREGNGRGTMNCLQCDEKCMSCIYTELCHEDCTRHCDVPVNPGTTNSTHESIAACNVPNCNPLHCNGSACYSCNRGYYRQSGSCVQCPDKCSTCINSTQCTTCKDAYWIPSIQCAYVCDSSCTDSGCNDIGYCHDCKPGMNGPYCRQDCKIVCKDGLCDRYKCTNGCKDSYYQITTGTGYSQCLKCEYDNCITCFNGTYCTECERGYYRNYIRQSNGRGTMNCLQCDEKCMSCISTELCHEDCTRHCNEPVSPGTTNSTHESTTIQNTTFLFSTSMTDPQTGTQKTSELFKSTATTPTEATVQNITFLFSTSMTDPQTRTQKSSELFKSTATTPTEDCHCLNGKLYEDLSSCQQKIKTCYECKDQYQLTFGHGLATGIGITIVLFGFVVGIALLIRRRTKLHKHENEASKGNHAYVNTNMTNMWSVIASESTEETNDIPTVSSDSTNTGVTDIDSSRDYVSLGDRQTHESDYSDLQNN